ncbi:MAG: succinyl-diaminopimelate desuccinylase [SAR324 cluster bacterium]|uniref:Succinyl-diaminopimelate desuccinylase n=1 Tax=SAR324 cluster bacterium TaxID=2024889 RepID=A0A2A4SQP6_9DELT|nr:MAG: succinyl-diaminopimelate desuccinylase [SAR324 cluster bacterium]
MTLNSVEQTLINLLEIDSVTAQEQAISNFVALKLDDLSGFQRLKTGLCHLYRTPHDPQKQSIAFYGHLDTVNNQQDKAPYYTDDFIFGCGASDMKGGLAIMMELMRYYSKQPVCKYNLIFVFYDQEEGPYNDNGLGPVLEEHSFLRNSDLAFILEPTNNVIQVGCLGALHAEVNFPGASAHSARPWEGENAIHKAGTLLTKLGNLARKEVDFQGLKYYEVLSATLAQGGISRNSIPASFTLNLNYRFAPGKSIAQGKEDVLKIVDSQAEVTFIDECPSADVVVGNPILDAFQKRFDLVSEPKQAWTDIARLSLYKIPAVNCGPGDPSQAHQKNEWIPRAGLLQGLQFYKEFLFD